jgi:hypothetical protein
MKTSNSGYVELVATAAEQASVAVRQPRFGQPLPVAGVVGAADPMPLMETVQTFAVQTCHASTVHGADVSARHCVGASQARRHATDVIKPSSADVTEARCADVSDAATAQASEPAADMRNAGAADMPQTGSAEVAHATSAEVAAHATSAEVAAHAASAEVASPAAMTTSTTSATAAPCQCRRRRRGNSKRDRRDRRKHNLAHLESPVAFTACSLAAFEAIEISRGFCMASKHSTTHRR